MKKFYFFILLMSFSSLAIGQSNSSKDEEVVKQLVRDAFEDIWSKLDAEKIKEYHTDDFLLLENGVLWNNDSITSYQRKELRANINTKRHNKFNFVKTEKSGNTIWVAYHNYASWTVDEEIVGKAHWLESAVAIKTEDGWKLQMLHSTRTENE